MNRIALAISLLGIIFYLSSVQAFDGKASAGQTELSLPALREVAPFPYGDAARLQLVAAADNIAGDTAANADSATDAIATAPAAEVADEVLSTATRDKSSEFQQNRTAFFLAATIVAAFGYHHVTARKQKKLVKLQNCDALTGLHNLQSFKNECVAHLRKNDGHSHAIVQLDINKFKIINDKLGFTEGDSLLCMCAEALHSALEDTEFCARSFADQFTALLRYDDLLSLKKRIYGILNTIEQWRSGGGMPTRVELRCGVYILDAHSHTHHDIQQGMDLAGYALQASKKRGKSRMVLYDESMRKTSLLHQDLKDSIGAALENEELKVWFQPKVNMLSNSVTGSEALARWYHPAHGLLLPGTFMPLFEQSGDVLRVDFYIFEQVCKTIHQWECEGIEARTVSCNFSSQHFERPEFCRRLVEIAARHSVAHELLEVEITESTMLQNPDAANIQIKRLRDLGFRTTIDDFGSGYSSLGLLQLFAADVIKFDRSFVKRNLAGKRAQIVLGSMIELTRQLGMSAICEGVETREQANILMQHGCYNAQGFYYARPMPADQFKNLLRVGRVSPEKFTPAGLPKSLQTART